MRITKISAIVPLVIFFMWVSVFARVEEESTVFSIQTWLAGGPVAMPMPAFHDVKGVNGKPFQLCDLLQFEQVEMESLWPETGKSFRWQGKEQVIRKELATESGELKLSSSGNLPQICYLAAYLHIKQFVKTQLEISGHHLFRAFLDGERLIQKTSADKGSKKEESVKKRIKLETGTHLLIVKMLRDPASDFAWNVQANLKLPAKFPPNNLSISLSPQQVMTVDRLLNGTKAEGVSVSPDGKLAIVSLRRILPPDGKSETWLELKRTGDGTLVRTFRGISGISSVHWAPAGTMFSYLTSGKEGKTLWVVDLQKGTTKPLLKNVKKMGAYTWAPDGSFLIYDVTDEAPKQKTGLKKLRGMTDRWPGWRNRSFLYRVEYPAGTRFRLTAGKLTTSLNDISPDGKKLIFTRTVNDFSERPYTKTQFFTLDLENMTPDSLWTSRWSGGAQWSPDGKKLLVTGGPSLFGKIGENVPDDMIPNDYDTQAYLYTLATGQIEPITKNFAPMVNRAVWSKTEAAIYFLATDKSYVRLFRYDLRRKQFEPIETGVDFISGFDLAPAEPVAVYTGSGVSQPGKAYAINLKKRRYHLLSDPGANDYKQVRFGRSERWTFRNARGMEIEGRIYFPPDFDPAKKYPCIVYYYGGTSPVTRDFGGRYPKEIWAANGYVVYVLQPSGATGFGQAFSALHVNDWGKIVADEIIDGSKQFLAAHSFVDEKRVGCIGASYGGFMTMLLQTKTDMFAAAVAHAGISLIPSYWGEGFWGYLYSAVATANSFPWNRKDIYVDRSPLFSADNVKTPILLLHGNADTNVPTGESRQFYTALKLLGRKVELIEIDGQNHHIMEYKKRKLWTKTIIAWFDKWLKNQPDWWQELYPE